MTPQITVQLYSVREAAAQDYEATLRAIADIGFTCVEPAGYPNFSATEAAKLYNQLGLKAPTCHTGLPVGDDKNQIIEEALMMGHQYLFTGCPPGFQETCSSVDRLKATAELYCEAAENLKPHGLYIGYHNHDWDLAVLDGKPAYKYFLENTPDSVLYEADVFWVARAGLDPAEFIKELGPRGKALHFKDGILSDEASFKAAQTESGNVMVSDSVPFMAAGTGEVDLIAASKAVEHAEYIGVELDAFEGDMLQAIRQSYDYLTRNGIARS